jgi:hypothetical protein
MRRKEKSLAGMEAVDRVILKVIEMEILFVHLVKLAQLHLETATTLS